MSNIDSAAVLYSDGNNDEAYTPRYGVIPLLEFIEDFVARKFAGKISKRKLTIWCPFDTEESEFVKVFREAGYKVINSHISTGQDFYEYEPDEEWDVMISNGPFTNKRLIFQRAISFNKPFALLMSNTWLNDSAPKQLFKDIGLELLLFDKRIEYQGQKKITFSSSYFCRDFLPTRCEIRQLNK